MQESLDNISGASVQTQVVDSRELHIKHARPARTKLTYDALVLDADLLQSLATVRSLGSRGLRVAALGTSSGLPIYSSRWCQRAFICPEEEATDEYFNYLEQVLEENDIHVLITSSDASIDMIRRHRKRFEQRVRIALAKETALAIALNKERTLEVAERLGISIPRAVTLESESKVEAALYEMELPVVVKPLQSWVWSNQQGIRLASKLVTTYDEARSVVEKLTHLGVKVVLQQYLSGKRESISFLYADGQIYARCAQWHKRSQPPLGGQSVLRQSIAIPPDIDEQAELLVREIDLDGCSEVEFRRDANGHPYLMEINPRLWASTELAVRAGVDFPYLLYQWASGEKMDMVKSYRVGGWLRYLRADITTTVSALEHRDRPEMSSPAKTILDFCASFFLPTAYDYVSLRDPLPAVKATAGGVSELVRKIGASLNGTRKAPMEYWRAPNVKNFVIPIYKEQEKVHAYFQSQSSYWRDIYASGGVNAEIYRNRHARVLNWVKSLDLAPGSKVLEVGCGAGFMSIALAERGFQVYAIDSVESMVEQTREHVKQAGVNQLLFLNTGDAYTLNFEDDSFNLVIALGVIPWLEQPELAISEMARVTRTGGYIILTADNRSRLNFLLDPLLNPAFAPLKLGMKQKLERLGIRRRSANKVDEVFHTYHDRHYIDKALASEELVKNRNLTLGFGPFTLFRRKVIPEALGTALHRSLQHFADWGIPGLRFTGSQYLVLVRKMDSQSALQSKITERSSPTF